MDKFDECRNMEHLPWSKKWTCSQYDEICGEKDTACNPDGYMEEIWHCGKCCEESVRLKTLALAEEKKAQALAEKKESPSNG